MNKNFSLEHCHDFNGNGQAERICETAAAIARSYPSVASGGTERKMDETYRHKEPLQIGGFSAEEPSDF